MTPSRVRAAALLWIACAAVVWNVIFDRVLVLAGRRYVQAAALAARESEAYLRIDDWMPAAASRGLWLASAGAGLALIAGFAAIAVGMRRERPRPRP